MISKETIVSFIEKDLEYGLMLHQKEFILDNAKRRIMHVGRRCGASKCLAAEALASALLTPNHTALIIAPYEDQTSNIFTDIIKLVENTDFYKRVVRNTKTPRAIRFSNGSRILGVYALKEEERNDISPTCCGCSVDSIYVDNCSYVPNELWPTFLPLLVDTKDTTISLYQTGGIVKGTEAYKCYKKAYYSYHHRTLFEVERDKGNAPEISGPVRYYQEEDPAGFIEPRVSSKEKAIESVSNDIRIKNAIMKLAELIDGLEGELQTAVLFNKKFRVKIVSVEDIILEEEYLYERT